VVRDGYGFFTTRVFASYLLEAATLVAQGYCPEMIEWVAKEAGMVMPPLKIFDEVSLKLGLHAIQMRSSYGHEMDFGAGCALIQKMIDHQRFGKINKAGFYDYLQKPSVIAPILQDFIAPEYQSNAQIHKNLHLKSTQEINALKTYLKNRLFLIQAIEASRALEEGVLLNQQDGDVASVLGIGFAPQSGGIFEWMKHQGQDWLITQSRLLEQQEGKRFTPPKIWENHGFF
jgi:3-hydroxyacyl-CoA dehydrogenase/enoyl-CoA hydratase/3-hydroxybutyryl-CoA epimerase